MKIRLIAAGILTTLPFWACAKDVTILYTNDLHAHVEPYKVPWIADGKTGYWWLGEYHYSGKRGKKIKK